MSKPVEEMLAGAADVAVESMILGDEDKAESALVIFFALALLGREQEPTDA
jgi:hypothetical protein